MGSPNPMGIISGLMGFYRGHVIGLYEYNGKENGNYSLRVLG